MATKDKDRSDGKYFKIFNASTEEIQDATEPLDTDIYFNKLAKLELCCYTTMVEMHEDIIKEWLVTIENRLFNLLERIYKLEAKPWYIKIFNKKKIKRLKNLSEEYKCIGGFDYSRLVGKAIFSSLKEVLIESGAEIGLKSIDIVEEESTENKKVYAIKGWGYHVPVWRHRINSRNNHEGGF